MEDQILDIQIKTLIGQEELDIRGEMRSPNRSIKIRYLTIVKS